MSGRVALDWCLVASQLVSSSRSQNDMELSDLNEFAAEGGIHMYSLGR